MVRHRRRRGGHHRQDDRAASPRLRRRPRRTPPRTSSSAWERRKRRQPEASEDPLGTLPASLPALATAYRQTLRAGDLGFDWERDADVVAKIDEEIREWSAASQAGDAAAETHEIGDLLLSVVNLARRRRIDPEAALRQANRRFRERFAGVARRARETGRDVSEVPMKELDAFWEEAKKE